MTLMTLIRKRGLQNGGTAISATATIQPEAPAITVAEVATVAVADNTGDMPANASRGWLLHFADSDPLEVYCNPWATHAELLGRYPEALAAEPMPKRITRAPTEDETRELRALVSAVGEAEKWEGGEFEWAIRSALADPDGALACYRVLAVEYGASCQTDHGKLPNDLGKK